MQKITPADLADIADAPAFSVIRKDLLDLRDQHDKK